MPVAMSRRLHVATRTVPAAQRSAYDAAWTRIATIVRGLDGRAWRFRREPRFLEFIEWSGDDDAPALTHHPALREASAALDASFPSSGSEIWEEAAS
jgi:hypothetical protein